MPIIIEELEAEVRPERDDRGEDAPSATALPTPALLAAITASCIAS